MSVIIPKTYVKNVNPKLIFLAGPIRGAPNWQDEAINYLLEQDPELTIASPKRGARDAIQQYITQGDETHFPRQRAWELHYQDIAARTGTIMFWLPGETEHNCSKAYGAMTRIELGEIMIHYHYNKETRFIIGSDKGFSELDTILYDLSVYAPDKKVYTTLKETCNQAIKMIQ